MGPIITLKGKDRKVIDKFVSDFVYTASRQNEEDSKATLVEN